MEIIPINFTWGGCGNLINNCLNSTHHYNKITGWYRDLTITETWTAQEWQLRDKIGSNLYHDNYTALIQLAWENYLDSSFHYIIKNPTINHINGSMLDKINIVLKFNKATEDKIKELSYQPVEELLLSSNTLYKFCLKFNPLVEYDTIQTIHSLWLDKTRECYAQHSEQMLNYFNNLELDYQPTTLYNILYENTNPRQHALRFRSFTRRSR